jgi:hypothetical protein
LRICNRPRSDTAYLQGECSYIGAEAEGEGKEGGKGQEGKEGKEGEEGEEGEEGIEREVRARRRRRFNVGQNFVLNEPLARAHDESHACAEVGDQQREHHGVGTHR